MTRPRRPAAEAGITLAILDDNQYVATASGAVHPVAATFHRFAEAVVRAGPFAPARYLAPVRRLSSSEPAPVLPAIDARLLRIVGTAPFAGIADYLRRAPRITVRNWPAVKSTIRDADLVWIRAPASNALLVAVAARLDRTPRFTYVTSSAREVVSGQEWHGTKRLFAACAGATYDGVTALLARTGPAIVLDAHVFSSPVTAGEVVAARHAARDAVVGQTPVLVWSGRMAEEKGLPDLLDAVSLLLARGMPVQLVLVGDGPQRGAIEAGVAARGLTGHVTFAGYQGERETYLRWLRRGDLFVLPSRAEGVPKVVVEAMAAGLPVVATRVGGVPGLLGDGSRGRLVESRDARALADAIAGLLRDDRERAELRDRGLAWAEANTEDALAARFVDHLRRTFPSLPWASGTDHTETEGVAA